MEYEKALTVIVLFLFSVFLFPLLNTAVQTVSVSDPLYPIIINFPLIFLVSVIVVFAYEVVHEG